MKRVAVSMRVTGAQDYHEPRDTISQDWHGFLGREFPEIAPLFVPNRPERVLTWLEAVGAEAVILSNGNDLGQAPERDETERLLIAHCIEHKVPLLGFCRGLQILNEYFGGEVSRIDQDKEKHVAVTHDVHVLGSAGGCFRKLAGAELLNVNSYHELGVRTEHLAPGLEAFAVTDGLVEGLFHPGEKIVAVQWHPERPNPATNFDRSLIHNVVFEGAAWTP